MHPYIQLIRSGNCSMGAFAAIVGVFIAYSMLNLTVTIPFFETVLIFIIVFLITGAGNSINDYFDVDIDSVNKPMRPIPSGRIGLSQALYFSLILFAAGTGLAFHINAICGFIALFNSLLLIYYAHTLKRTVLLGNLSVGYLTGSTFLFGGAVFGIAGLKALSVLFLLATFATIAREIVKDIEDIEGDKKDGANTLPIKIGAKSSAYVAAFVGFLAVLASPIPYMQSMLSPTYLYIVAFADVLFAVAVFEIIVRRNAARSSKLFKIAMLFALLSFAAGSV
ncbi:MAG TPA: geranylgeranylglycerol-phosphate geranylgeranyltransferase [Methanosarcinaceae archaeon]|nr:geranylgeranylglycerol-phosphate geranylgeranyltransferase [Methanosarcinaceae archaeon]